MTNLIIRPAVLPDELPALAKLCWDYRDLLITRTTHVPNMVEKYYSRASYTRLINDLPRIHSRPSGDILVAELGDIIVGCAMYYLHSSGHCEVKRIFVSQAARGFGAGFELLDAAKRHAASDGHKTMVLDTVHTLFEAIALYERSGFVPDKPFYDPDPAFIDTLRLKCRNQLRWRGCTALRHRDDHRCLAARAQ